MFDSETWKLHFPSFSDQAAVGLNTNKFHLPEKLFQRRGKDAECQNHTFDSGYFHFTPTTRWTCELTNLSLEPVETKKVRQSSLPAWTFLLAILALSGFRLVISHWQDEPHIQNIFICQGVFGSECVSILHSTLALSELLPQLPHYLASDLN